MSDNITAKALDLYCKGFSVFPVKHGSKYPYKGFTWKKYQTEKPTFEQTVQWFKQYPHSNIAILTGKVSSNLVVVDFDSLLKYFEWQNSDRYVETFTIRTGRGFHCYFHIENMPKHTYKLDKIDVKSNGYVLSEGSLHPSGWTYQVHVNQPIAQISGIEQILDLECVFYDAGNTAKKNHSRSLDITDNPESLLEELLAMSIKLPIDVCQQIKSRLKVLDVLGISENDLTLRGTKTFAICPCHNDHDPSLHVDLKTNRVFCYSPNCALHTTHGNSTIDLYAAMNGLQDREAMIILAQNLGLLEDKKQ